MALEASPLAKPPVPLCERGTVASLAGRHQEAQTSRVPDAVALGLSGGTAYVSQMPHWPLPAPSAASLALSALHGEVKMMSPKCKGADVPSLPPRGPQGPSAAP